MDWRSGVGTRTAPTPHAGVLTGEMPADALRVVVVR